MPQAPNLSNNALNAGLDKGVVKKVIPMFFLIDMSGSMYGSRIAAVNNAMNQLWPELKKVQGQEKLFDIKIRIITFGLNGAQWKVGSPNSGVLADDFVWNDIPITAPDGGTPTDQAIELLLTCINDNVYREYIGRRFALPFIMLVTDGESNSQADFKAAVDKLLETRIGQSAILCAIGIDTANNPDAADEIKIFARNGFRHCDDMELSKIAELISTATFRTIKLSNDQTPKDGNVVDVFNDPDTF
ncbi:MAG: VWA domain-containing protein [Clostridiales bacterium]|jgi:uncharacterized protein YegL|nr:VWA domain-containing protein [Clostridiales bacterium]